MVVLINTALPPFHYHPSLRLGIGVLVYVSWYRAPHGGLAATVAFLPSSSARAFTIRPPSRLNRLNRRVPFLHFFVCVAVLPPFSSAFRSLWPEGARRSPERTSRRVLPCCQTLPLSFSFSSLVLICSDSRADSVPQPRPHCTCSLLVH